MVTGRRAEIVSQLRHVLRHQPRRHSLGEAIRVGTARKRDCRRAAQRRAGRGPPGQRHVRSAGSGRVATLQDGLLHPPAQAAGRPAHVHLARRVELDPDQRRADLPVERRDHGLVRSPQPAVGGLAEAFDAPSAGRFAAVSWLSTSSDFVHWTEPRYIFRPDQLRRRGLVGPIEAVRPMLDRVDDPTLMRTEFYGVGVYQHESCLVAFPWVFTINNNGRYGNHEGPCEIQLAVLKARSRPVGAALLRADRAAGWRARVGQWIPGHVGRGLARRRRNPAVLCRRELHARHALPVPPERSRTRNEVHQQHRPGDVEARPLCPRPTALREGGRRLTTIPIVYRGSRLELNAATRPGGSIIVELLSAAGERLARSRTVSGDGLRQAIVWENDIDLLRGRASRWCCVSELRDAQLFSFAFRTVMGNHPLRNALACRLGAGEDVV